MTNKEILDKINRLTENFQTEPNCLKKFIVVYEYVDFLNNNSKLEKLFREEKENSLDTLNSLLDGSTTFGDFGLNQGGFNFDDNIGFFYAFMDAMHKTMEEYKILENETKAKEVERKMEKVIKDPMQKFIFDMSFSVLNKKIFNQLNKEDFKNDTKNKNELRFDKDKSILYFKNKKVKIKRKADLPLEHYILEYIFEQDDLKTEVYFREIAEDKLGETDYNGLNDWKKYYRACEKLQEKVRVETGVDNFLIFSTGKTANVMINKQYIPLK